MEKVQRTSENHGVTCWEAGATGDQRLDEVGNL